MKKLHWRRLVSLLLAIAVLGLPAILLSRQASANPGLNISGALLVADVSPGQTLTWPMSVSIATADPAVDIAVHVMGMTQSPDGVNQDLAVSDDTSPYSARSFITVDKSSFHLDPGASETVTAAIQIPQNVGTGGRYAIINIAEQAAGGSSVNIVAAVNVQVALTIKDSQIIHTGKITGVTVGKIDSGQPVSILTDFQSTGNHHFKVKGEATVRNPQGQILDTVPMPLTSSSILPGMVRQLQASFIPSGDLAPGTYAVDSKVMLEDGTLLDQSSTTFEVKDPYTAPPAVGSIKLTASSTATLETEDGSISIHFPQGAAVMSVEVSLRDYLPEQLPNLPSGITLTKTCFRVDGLTGLLAKDATITVKYTADDLAKADGDASRLRLARWDDATSQWTVLKTRVDKGAMTVSADSNHMGIWAVLVTPASQSGNSSSWVTPAIIGGVIVSAVAAILLFRRRKRRAKSG
jgi:hypothetical protein